MTKYLLGMQFKQETERIPVPTMTEPDPEWRKIDDEGHLHAYVRGQLPTLDWVEVGEEDEGFYKCTICGEEIHPGIRTPTHVKYIAGMTTNELIWTEVEVEDGQRKETRYLASGSEEILISGLAALRDRVVREFGHVTKDETWGAA